MRAKKIVQKKFMTFVYFLWCKNKNAKPQKKKVENHSPKNFFFRFHFPRHKTPLADSLFCKRRNCNG